MTRHSVLHGDCLHVLPTLNENSVDAVVTDPPYGLGFMGKGWDHGAPGSEFWTAALRVAKPGAHLLAFGGTRTFHRLTCAIEDAGWDIRDCLMWIYGTGFPKSLNVGDGIGTALKPAWEPIILARKPLDGTVAQTVLKWGTGTLNIDGCRVPTDDDLNGGAYSGGVRPSPMFEGSLARLDPSVFVQPSGRWPATLIHDGSAEVVELFPQSKRQQGDTTGDEPSVPTASSTGRLQWRAGYAGSAARFFYCAKASKAEREAGCETLPLRQQDESRNEGDPGGDNPRNRGGSASRRNHHPTVKPVALMRYLCRLVTPPGGLVLDPFCGSGSTGVAAKAEGLSFVGVDAEAEYVAIAQARISR